MQLFDDEFADKFEFDVLDADQTHSRRGSADSARRPAGARSLRRQLLRRDRAGGVLHAEYRAGHRLQRTIRCLQGRNFSYLDTQLKRLGSPNFTHLPINAPKCPFRNFQQDGHMAIVNPKGRVNYEPNSWGCGGRPARNPKRGFRSYPARRGEASAARAERNVRRSFQPGAPILHQPNRR